MYYPARYPTRRVAHPPLSEERWPLFHASNLDGTNDYLTRGSDLTGIADGKQGTLSVWINSAITPSGANMNILRSSNAATGLLVQISDTQGDVCRIVGVNAAAAVILDIRNTTAITSATGWFHLLASWNLATAGARQVFFNDADETTQATFTDDAIDYTTGGFAAGGSTTGAEKFNGGLAELWFTTTYLDLSVEANRRKFITASGKPADLGPDGSRPTGSSPSVYLRHPASQFGTNSGTGGNFTVNGALTPATTRPA